MGRSETAPIHPITARVHAVGVLHVSSREYLTMFRVTSEPGL
jgi:hypothetical protein